MNRRRLERGTNREELAAHVHKVARSADQREHLLCECEWTLAIEYFSEELVELYDGWRVCPDIQPRIFQHAVAPPLAGQQ
jgi:hypothetical protein